MAKSLLFCTSYFETEETYFLRYKKWISYYSALSFTDDKDIFILDDGSNLAVADNLYNYIEGDITEDTKTEKVNFYHFPERLTQGIAANSEGWYRSFLYSYDIATTLGYDKIIHIESDLYLLSPKICEYINNLNSGWVSFKCPTYQFPESSLQIINKDNYKKFFNFQQEVLAKGLWKMSSKNAEWIIPFSRTETRFVGDRYGERKVKQNETMDYYAQANLAQNFVFDMKNDHDQRNYTIRWRGLKATHVDDSNQQTASTGLR